MIIDKNIIIKCNNLEEVKDCLDKLKELGFNVCFNNNKDQLVVSQTRDINSFQNYIWTKFYSENFCVNYNTFIKLYNKQIDLLVDKNGKILKVNNIHKDYKVFVRSSYGNWIDEYTFSGEYIEFNLIEVDYYVLKEDLEKALKRKEIENKLRLLAFKLNGNRDITKEEYINEDINKYSLYFNFKFNAVKDITNINHKGCDIYCLSKDFKDKAIDLIGEEDLKEYLMNY